MTENKRYFKKEYDEEYYIFDSEIISEKRVDKFIEYDYKVFASSMTDDEIVDLLNGQEERIIDLKNTIIKITIAYQRKHDNTIVNLVDEIWEEDIEDLFIELNQDEGIRND